LKKKNGKKTPKKTNSLYMAVGLVGGEPESKKIGITTLGLGVLKNMKMPEDVVDHVTNKQQSKKKKEKKSLKRLGWRGGPPKNPSENVGFHLTSSGCLQRGEKARGFHAEKTKSKQRGTTQPGLARIGGRTHTMGGQHWGSEQEKIAGKKVLDWVLFEKISENKLVRETSVAIKKQTPKKKPRRVNRKKKRYQPRKREKLDLEEKETIKIVLER